MARLEVEVPDGLLVAAKARAERDGCPTLEAYVRAVLEADLIEHDPELERLLLERLDDPRPSIDATPEFWDELKARVREQIATQKVSL